ncbi:MAG TPA: mercuric transport protein periplasmic component [Aliiroseovarius sp.]|nr:mercuric transport protein periplasmic component [Aliiroseovarius sp.]
MAASPLVAAEQKVTFSVPGMYCASCPFIVESAMGSVDGVLSVEADSESRTAKVVFDDEITSVESIAQASAEAGYEAEILMSGS